MKIKIKILILSYITLMPFLNSSCGSSLNKKGESNEATIKDQVWMTQNLNADTFQNGDKIIQVKSIDEWESAIKNKQAAWCYYEFNSANEKKLGKIYNLFAVSDSRKLAPTNWRIPNENDWKKLVINLDPDADTTKLYLDENFDLKTTLACKKLKNHDWNGTNESNFNALPGGFIGWAEDDGGSRGGFYELNSESKWWSFDSKVYGAFSGFTLFEKEKCYFHFSNSYVGYYVRCIKH